MRWDATAGRSACSIATSSASRTSKKSLSGAGLTVLAYPGDVTNADELTVAVNSFAATHDGLDVMVNNAGVAGGGTLMEVPLEDWRWIIDINFMGVVHGCARRDPASAAQRHRTADQRRERCGVRVRARHDLVQRDQGGGAVAERNAEQRAARRGHAGVGRDADVLQDQPARIVSRAAGGRVSRRSGMMEASICRRRKSRATCCCKQAPVALHRAAAVRAHAVAAEALGAALLYQASC